MKNFHIILLCLIILTGGSYVFFQMKQGFNQTHQVPTTFASNGKTFSLQEVAKHNTITDCWMVIHNRVYDVTSFIPVHPGGDSMIGKGCGMDATTLFENRRYPGDAHPPIVQKIMQQYYIGDLKQ